MKTNILISTYYKYRRIILDPLAWFLSKRQLHHYFCDVSVKGALEATEQFVGKGFYSSINTKQVEEEIIGLAELVQKHRPKTIVEIGTNNGGTFFIWCRTNPQAQLIASIDLPGGMYGGGYDLRRAKLYKEFVADRSLCQVLLLRADSHDPATLESLVTKLNGATIDFLFIDGDHTYEGVKQDFEMYSSLVDNGLIAFHDIVTHNQGCGVDRFWEEIKPHYPFHEWIASKSHKGIGVIFKNPKK